MTRAHRVVIPDEIAFADLRLARGADGSVSFEPDVVRRICAASGIDPAVILLGPEDNVAGLIIAWYAEHLLQGGEPDPIAEQIGAEVRAEDGYEGLQ